LANSEALNQASSQLVLEHALADAVAVTTSPVFVNANPSDLTFKQN
jgi:hypothetical protein